MIRIMLSKKIEEAINAQINAEMWSAYLYLSMAAYCHLMGQTGTARWNEVQFKEEQDHAKILFNYVVQRNGKVILSPIKAVPTEWKSLLDVFESILEHEQKITAMINKLFALSTEENDYATQSMLKWFVDEQVEEEENAQTIIDNLNMIKDNGFGIFMLDKELGTRVYAQAAPLANSTL
jgi:ferritin